MYHLALFKKHYSRFRVRAFKIHVAICLKREGYILRIQELQSFHSVQLIYPHFYGSDIKDEINKVLKCKKIKQPLVMMKDKGLNEISLNIIKGFIYVCTKLKD